MGAIAGKKRILIIDDDGDIRDTIGECLELEGYEVQSAPNGEEALIQLSQSPKPHLILLDLEMPHLDGFGFRQEQREDPALAEIPVVVISADQRDPETSRKLNPSAYLRKPVELNNLIDAVRRYCL